MQAVYLQGADELLFGVFYAPAEGRPAAPWIVFAAPFAEEMNKSRAVVAGQARAFAEQGFPVLVLDYSGTGDSGADFADVCLTDWVADLQRAVDWAGSQGATAVVLWGLRLGCQLLLAAAPGLSLPICGMLLWQPVFSARLQLKQFLRLRSAAAMIAGEAESGAQLQQRLQDGETLEIAGYRLSQALFSSAAVVDERAMRPPPDIPLWVFEVSKEGGPEPSPGLARVLSDWQEHGVQAHYQRVVGESFWTTQELAWADDLLNESGLALAGLQSVPTGQATSSELGATPVAGPPDATATPVVFECEGSNLLGVLNGAKAELGLAVVLIVGGPQYRAGSHRQFLQLAQYLAESGVPVLRFDYRGMGDSEGEYRGFRYAGADIRAAVDMAYRQIPELEGVVLWGLCDAATAAAHYAPSDPRVLGQVLLNPWVRSDAGEAKAYLQHYYLARLGNPQFWSKLLRGGVDLRKASGSLLAFVARALRPVAGSPAAGTPAAGSPAAEKQRTMSVNEALAEIGDEADLVGLLQRAISDFPGEMLVLLSDNDLTAAEYRDCGIELRSGVTSSGFGQQAVTVAQADHTFSRTDWKRSVELATLDCVRRVAHARKSAAIN